ncbi:MAG: PAS domain S-box protein [Desulfotomaculaceae bacterium]|nr:PAS domain S-box protein [Desulfotomaculaceae bacterium]
MIDQRSVHTIILEQSYDGIALVDEQGRFLEWNRSLEYITGLKRSEVQGRPCWAVASQLLPGGAKPMATYERLKTAVLSLLETGESPSRVEAVIQAPDGTRKLICVTSFSIKTAQGYMLGMIVRDSTNGNLLEEELQQLDQSEKLVPRCMVGYEKVNRQFQLEIAKRKQVEQALSRQLEISLAITGLSRKLLSPATIEDISDLVLEHAKHLTGSKYGYVGYIEPETGYLVCCTMTRDIWDKCEIEGKDIVYKRFGDLGGWVVRNEKSLLTNSPATDPRSAGTPPGHIPIERVISAPAIFNESLVGIITLANSPRAYREQDLALIERLADLYAIAVHRKRSEDALRISEANYRAIFDGADDAILVHDLQTGIVTDVNQKACQMFGCRLQECNPKRGGRLINLPQYARDSVGKWMTEVAKGEPLLFESTLKEQDGASLSIEVSLKQAVIGGKESAVAIVRDITRRRQLEREMLRLDRLHLVGEMAASFGHEIRNPMTSVRGLLQVLGDKPECLQYKEIIDLMIGELDRANSIIQEFLSLAKDRAVDLKVQNMNSILEAVFPLIMSDALLQEKYIEVELGDVPALPFDEKEIRQVILNLVRNGLEAMPPRGCLTIRTFTEGNEVVLSVRDQGTGIEPDNIEKIGNPFFTTKEQGTGLGLAVCYSIAARHGATIRIETGSGGSTFFFGFPRPDNG